MPSSGDSSEDDDSIDVDDGAVIVPIAQNEVHRIVAGQAISDLGSAVKELLDNSLDAGAKRINSKT